MRPPLAPVEIAPNVSAFVQGEKRFIRADVDARFRKMLTEAVAQDGNPSARFHIGNALEKGPSRGGVQESIAYFGKEIDVKLAITAGIVDALEITMPGFKRWLQLTGFGNDKTMIRGFVAWAEHKNGIGRVNSSARAIAER